MNSSGAQPAISVLVPVFNAARYVRESIESIVSQSFSGFELICVDDGSTDDSLAILSELRKKDGRIKLISRPNTGLVGALNDGLEIAAGEFIARMDADDVSVPHRFEKQLQYLLCNKHVLGVSGATRYIDDEGLPVFDFVPPIESEQIAQKLKLGCGEAFLHGAAMIRRQAIVCAGGYREECRHIEDVDLFLRILKLGELSNLSEIMLYYRMHQGSICHQFQHQQQSQLSRLLGGTFERKGHRERHTNFRQNLAYTALRAGNWKTARVNALKDLRRRPSSAKSLLIFMAAIAGIGRSR